MFFVASCTSQENVSDVADQRTMYINDECYDSATYSLADSFDAFMVERQEELKILRAELSAENYEQLDYALRHFETYWDKLTNERNMACEQHATCQYIWLKNPELQSSNSFCDGTDFEYSVSRAKMINFFNDIERLQLERTVP
ncbi:hypothetical protein C9I98_09515 [Photobacterium sanctipauli]|uniref:Uncharacterized protein n=2 Tax=Photobacterium sanctipauli TaxID=1342794 RepID=A0A2T3NVV5_9GAMM|nr:hypothetical protein C9I98_09515 [Photobacterium sanctipauli]